MKNLITPLFAILFVCFLACGKDDEAPNSDPTVNFINAVPDLGIPSFVTAVIRNDTTFNSKIAYTGGSTSKSIPTGNHSIIFTNNAGAQIYSSNYNFAAGTNTCMVLCNLKSNIEFLGITNYVKSSTDTLGSLRFVNLIPNSSLSVTLNGNNIGNLTFKSLSSSIDVKAGNSLIEVTGSALSNKLSIPSFKVNPGKSWLIYITGPGSGVATAAINSVALN